MYNLLKPSLFLLFNITISMNFNENKNCIKPDKLHATLEKKNNEIESSSEQNFYDVVIEDSIDYHKTMDTFKTWKYSYLWLFVTISLSLSLIAASYVRTMLFTNLSEAIANSSHSTYNWSYILIALCNISEYVFAKFLLDFFSLRLSAQNRMNEQFFQCVAEEDLSHRIFADQKFVVEYFYKMIFYFCYSIVGSLIFFAQYIYFAYHYVEPLAISLPCIVTISSLIILITRYLSKKYSAIFMRNEDYLRKLMYSWNDKNALNDLIFPSDIFKMYIIKSRNAEIGISFLSYMYQLGQVLILLIPYLMYAKHCIDGNIGVAEFYKITGYLTGAILSFSFIDTAVDYFGKYIVSRDRLNKIKMNNYTINSENKILIQNLMIKYDEKIIIENFNLECLEGQKYNIVAAHGIGKTTLFKAIKDQINFSGEIHYPKSRTYKISENFVIPENCKFNKTDAFIKNCKLLEVDDNLDLNKCSGSQRWRLVAAYALCYDFIIWDDPFAAGEKNERIMDLFFTNMKSGIIFSSKNIEKINNINLNS